jgi:hypothetical protein
MEDDLLGLHFGIAAVSLAASLLTCAEVALSLSTERQPLQASLLPVPRN